jgi:hypothetical protein
MKDKKEIPKYHCSGNVKYYFGKMNKNLKKQKEQLRAVTEVCCFSQIDLINLSKESYEKNIIKPI